MRKSDTELLIDAIAGMLARVENSVPTMAYADIVTLLRIGHALGYLQGRQEQLYDIRLFEGKDEDETE